MPFHPLIYLSQSIYVFVYLSIFHPSIHLPSYLSIHLFINQFIYLCIYLYIYVYPLSFELFSHLYRLSDITRLWFPRQNRNIASLSPSSRSNHLWFYYDRSLVSFIRCSYSRSYSRSGFTCSTTPFVRSSTLHIPLGPGNDQIIQHILIRNHLDKY